MRVAVTGATGFLGRHVVAALMATDVRIALAARRREALEIHEDRCDVIELGLERLPPDPYELLGRPDALIHLAWGGLPNFESPHHFESELPRHFTFLKRMVEAGLPHAVVTGTCLEYGMRAGALSPTERTDPTTAYGIAKDTLRRQLQHTRLGTRFGLTWARLFYMYGEGQAPNALYPALRRAVANRDPTFGMSSGEQLRDYLPVTEVARQLVALAVSGRPAGVINVCSGTPISVRALVERWIAAEGWTIDLKLGAYALPAYEPMAFWGIPFEESPAFTPRAC
jgi:nucleoside-diphosphate-sugar epimerase